MPSKGNPPCGAPDPRVAFFDRLSADWDNHGAGTDETVRRLEAVGGLLGLAPGQDLLEVGCGTGRLTAWLAQAVNPGRVTAVDFAPGMIAAASAKGIDATFLCADVCVDDLGDKCFDVAFCFHCFPHFRDRVAATQMLARCLKPAGRLIVMHLRGSAAVDAHHDRVGGAVAGDHLPAHGAWDDLLGPAGLVRTRLIDRDDLFFLAATRRAT